jgi:hypothetical protein
MLVKETFQISNFSDFGIFAYVAYCDILGMGPSLSSGFIHVSNIHLVHIV